MCYPLLRLSYVSKHLEADGGDCFDGCDAKENSPAKSPKDGMVYLPWHAPRPNGENVSFTDVYNFMRDRLRGVWQDLTVQHCYKHQVGIFTVELCIFMCLWFMV